MTIREGLVDAIRANRSDSISKAVDNWLTGTLTTDEIALNLEVEKVNSGTTDNSDYKHKASNS
jgi:hypothetical protein